MSKKKSSSSDLGVSGGKGDVPRSCFSKQFRDNYDAINWGRKFEVSKDFCGTLNDLTDLMVNKWTKENDDALHKFCDNLKTCNIYSPKKS